MDQTASIECQKIFECCDSTEVMAQFQGLNPPVTTEAQCENFYKGLLQAFVVPQTQASIDGGRLVYHSDRAGDCLDALSSQTCADFSGFSTTTMAPNCTNPFEGQQANGDPCAQDDECTSGYCEGAANGADGACKPVPGAGADCPDDTCADGYWCDFASNQTCVATKADGMTCSSSDECQSGNCDSGSGMCSSAAVCDGM